MEVANYTLTSKEAQKDFDLVVYGTKGQPVIVFPEGDSSCMSWENNGMLDAVRDLVEDGTIRLVCVDSSDDETWYARGALNPYRLENLENFFAFVGKDLLPFVRKVSSNARKKTPLLAGVGIGALNATIALLRKPASYAGLLALSGTYDLQYFFDEALDSAWQAYAPYDLVDGLMLDGSSAKKLSSLPIAFACGQEGSETGIGTQRALQEKLAQKNIQATFEYWGYDVSHDWYWWQEETRQLLPCLLEKGGLDKRAKDAEIAAAQAEADHAADIANQRQQELVAARDSLEDAKLVVKKSNERYHHEEEQVQAKQANAAKYAQIATEAWIERDRIAALLNEAIRKGDEAQAQADAAAKELSDAEWIAGEARADAHHAVVGLKDAVQRLVDCEQASVAADEDKVAADKALKDLLG